MFYVMQQKRFLRLGYLILSLLIALSAFVSCSPSIEDMDYPDERLLSRISEDYRKYLIEEGLLNDNTTATCNIIRCYGIYNDSVAVIIYCDELWYPCQAIGNSKRIAEITFFDYPPEITVWNNSVFYGLDEAYVENILTQKDIWEIAKKHNCYEKDWMAERYSEYMSKNGEKHKNYVLDFYYGIYNNGNYNENDYREGYAVMFNDTVPNEPHVETIEGVTFYYKNGNSIKIMIDNGTEFLSLEEAYDRNIITKSALEEIADIHNNQRYIVTE